jgi:hypothetical protein
VAGLVSTHGRGWVALLPWSATGSAAIMGPRSAWPSSTSIRTILIGVHEVARLLAGLAAQDDAFRQELAVLVDEARHDPTVGPLATRVYGQAQIGQLLNIGQARDIYI